MIWALVVLFVVLWALGGIAQVGGDLLWILLVLAVVGVIYNLFISGRTPRA